MMKNDNIPVYPAYAAGKNGVHREGMQLSEEKARGKDVAEYFSTSSSAQIEISIYAKVCIATNEKPSFNGIMKGLGANVIISQTGKTIYRHGDKIDLPTVNKVFLPMINDCIKYYRTFPFYAKFISQMEQRYLDRNGLHITAREEHQKHQKRTNKNQR
jgi:hypothetical protein